MALTKVIGSGLGEIPAISGANLTGLKAGTAAFAARFSGTAAWVESASGAIIPFNDDSTGDSFDTDGVFNTSTYKFTAPATGVYMFWYALYTAQTDATNHFSFLKNSASFNMQLAGTNMLSFSDSAVDHIQSVSVVIPLVSGNTVAVISTSVSDIYTGHCQWGGCRLA